MRVAHSVRHARALRLSLLAGTALTLAGIAMVQPAFAQYANLNDSDGNLTTTTGAPLSTTQAGSSQYDDVISGNGSFTVNAFLPGSPATLTLTGNSTYSGGTVINDGATLSLATSAQNIGDAAALAAGNGLTFNGGTLQTPIGGALYEEVTIGAQGGTLDTDGHATAFLGQLLGSGTGTVISTNGAGSLTLGTDVTSFAGNGIIGNGNAADPVTLALTKQNNLSTGSTLTLNNGTVETLAAMTLPNNITLDAAGGTIDTDGNNATFSGVFSNGNGAGSLTKTGAGTLTLTGNSTYSGGTTVDEGILSLANNAQNIGDAAALAAGNGLTLNGGELQTPIGGALYEKVTIGPNGGTLDTDGHPTAFFGQLLGTGTGTVISTNGPGSLTLGTNVLNFAGNGVIGNGNTADPITLILTRADNLASTSNLTLNNGTLRTLVASTLGNNITIASGGGTLDVYGNADVLTGTLSSGGVARVISTNGAGSVSVGGNLGNFFGSAVLGDGSANAVTAILTAPLTIPQAGSLTMNNATLQTAAPASLGTNIGLGAGGGTVDTDGNDDTLSGVISDAVSGTPGAFTKVGAGTLLLTGSSTYTGPTTVSDGTLAIGDAPGSTASLASAVTVQPTATLSGFGTLGSTLTNSGGTVAPGSTTTVGTLTVNGNYVQSAAGTFAVQITPAAASRLNVGGSATLNGALSLLPATGTYAQGTTYTILSAASGVNGTFSSVTNSNASVNFAESYLPNAVQITVLGNGVTTSAGGITALTPNESASQGAIAALLPSVTSASQATGLAALLGAAGGASRAQLAGVLGELRADIATIDLANLTSFQNFIVERMASRNGLGATMQASNLQGFSMNGTQLAMNDSDMSLFGPGPNSMLTVDQPSVYVHGYGVLGDAGDQHGFQDFQYQTGGIVAGVDAKVTDSTLVGAAIAYEQTQFHLTSDEGDGNTIDTYRATVYGSQDLGVIGVPLTADAAFGYAFNNYHDNDSLSVPGFTVGETSQHTGNELTAETGLSHGFNVQQDLVSGALSIVPRVGVEYDNIAQDKYATTSTVSGLGLNTNAATLNALRSTVGAKVDLKMTTGDGTVVTPEFRASYLHDFMDTNIPLTETFGGATAGTFRVAGVHPGRDAALVGAGVNVGFSEHTSVTIGYDAGVRQHEMDNTIQVGIKYTW
jgi:outer membrane autotransporter protein